MFLFFGGLPKKTNALGGHKGCVFSFLVLPEKTIGGHRGCVFPFLMLQKNKSNRRAQASCFCFFLGWASKKTNPIGGHKGCAFCFCGASTQKKSPIGGHKGYGFAFFGAAKKQTQ